MNVFTHSHFWYEITQYVNDVVYQIMNILTTEIGAPISDLDSTVTFVSLLLMCGIWLLVTIFIYKLAYLFVSKIIKLFGGI